MKIEIRVTYAATDGRMPEDVWIEIIDEAAPYCDEVVRTTMPFVEKLLVAPSARQLTEAWDGAKEAVKRASRPIQEGAPLMYTPDGRVTSWRPPVTGDPAVFTSYKDGSEIPIGQPFVVMTSGESRGSLPPVGLGGLRVVPDPPPERCRRILCGHERADHGSRDDQGTAGPSGSGVCLVCENTDKCRSFVGYTSPTPEAGVFLAGEDIPTASPMGWMQDKYTLLRLGPSAPVEAGIAGCALAKGGLLTREGEGRLSTWFPNGSERS